MGRAGCSVIYKQRQQLTNCSSHGWVPVSLRIIIRVHASADLAAGEETPGKGEERYRNPPPHEQHDLIARARGQ